MGEPISVSDLLTLMADWIRLTKRVKELEQGQPQALRVYQEPLTEEEQFQTQVPPRSQVHDSTDGEPSPVLKEAQKRFSKNRIPRDME